MRLLYSAILNDKGITLGAIAAKDGGSIEGEIKTFGESQAWIRKESDLTLLVYCLKVQKVLGYDLRHLIPLGLESCPTPSCCMVSVTRTHCLTHKAMVTQRIRHVPTSLRDRHYEDALCCMCWSRLHPLKAMGATSTRNCLIIGRVVQFNRTNLAGARAHLHEAVVDGHNENLSSILEFGGVDVTRDMIFRASG